MPCHGRIHCGIIDSEAVLISFPGKTSSVRITKTRVVADWSTG